jgi:hypothetical protein
VVHGHDQGEALFDEDTIGIHIGGGEEIALDTDTIACKPRVQDLGNQRRVIGFPLALQETAALRVRRLVMVVMVVPIAPAQDACEQE